MANKKQIYTFKSKGGKVTDVFHSMEFLSKSLNDRRTYAFDIKSQANLSKEDKLRLEGYRFKAAEDFCVYKYNETNNSSLPSKKCK